MAEQLVVGAGLAGLTAATLLARKGYEVRVLEKYKTVGGQPERWPCVDVTPMLPDRLGDYIGIPLGDPQVKPCKRLNGYFWGKGPYDVPLGRLDLCCVERGPRKTALDGYLRDLAEEAGVKIEYGSPVLGQGEIAALPPDTIIATGLYAESFDALGIPYTMGWCYGTKGTIEDKDSEAAIYFGDYTNDYAYWACLNGIWMILFFTRNPIRRSELESFEDEAGRTEGLKAEEWLYGYGPTPTRKLSNPRLFASDKILAGTLSGMIEPFSLFGVHGALVSGKIAAMAVEDRSAAYLEFRRCLHSWREMLLQRRIYNAMSMGMRRRAIIGLNETLKHTGDFGAWMLTGMFRAVPGYRRVKKGVTTGRLE
ncbi:MAG: NAD(P)-binding protein [Actinomycetota bacterium]